VQKNASFIVSKMNESGAFIGCEVSQGRFIPAHRVSKWKPGDFYANGANNQDSSQLLTILQFKDKNCNFSFAAHVSVPSQYLFAAFGDLRLGLCGTLVRCFRRGFDYSLLMFFVNHSGVDIR